MNRIASIVSCLLLLIGCESDSGKHRGVCELSIAHLVTLSHGLSTPITEDYYIRGRVVLNDKMDEISKALVIVDATAGVEIKLDSDDIDAVLPLHCEVEVRLSGLSLGREYHKMVLGAKPTKDYVVDRIAEAEIYNYFTVSCEVAAPPKALHRRIPEIGIADMSRYVRIDSVWFVKEAWGDTWCWCDSLTHRYTTTLRHITDGRDTLAIVVAGECDYAEEELQYDLMNCYGVVESYQEDVALRITNHGAVLLRD